MTGLKNDYENNINLNSGWEQPLRMKKLGPTAGSEHCGWSSSYARCGPTVGPRMWPRQIPSQLKLMRII